MRRLLFLATLVAASIVVSSAGAVNAPPVTFTSPAGDSGTAADITSISVTNDDHGLVTFTISFATPYVNNDYIAVLLNTDHNAATGDFTLGGADYLFEDDYASHSFDLASWANNDWQAAPSATASVTVANDNKSITMSVNKSELGNTTGFDFFVYTADGAGGAGHEDGAGTFSYNLQSVFTLSPGSYHDGAAKAGGTWTVSMTAVRSDNGQTLTSGASVVCAAKEGTKTLAVQSSSFGASGAVCTFRVPKKPKHGRLSAKVTISDNGQSTAKTFTATH